MYFCNICGKPTLELQTSHQLGRNAERTGKIFRTCSFCHINYHKKRGDFVEWGKKGALKKREKKFSKWSR